MTDPTIPPPMPAGEPTTTYSCRYEFLAEQAALVEDRALDVDPCERPAKWATKIHLHRDGQDVDTTTRLCEHHDAQVRAWPGHIDEPERLLLPPS